MALGCLHPVTKVQSGSIHFFLSSEEDEEDNSDEDEVRVYSQVHDRFRLIGGQGDRRQGPAS